MGVLTALCVWYLAAMTAVRDSLPSTVCDHHSINCMDKDDTVQIMHLRTHSMDIYDQPKQYSDFLRTLGPSAFPSWNR